MYPVMEYPETEEEFMDQYKVTDSLGIDMVPLFRMKQWFAHKRGAWEELADGIKCSACGCFFDSYTLPHKTQLAIKNYKYCPNCGSKMREKVEQ